MVMIDFFKVEVPVEERVFGICDDEDKAAKTPAYVDANESNKHKWIAVVTNSSGKPVSFIAVDNKIEIRRENGVMENRCDAMLHNEKYIIFVELKKQQDRWIQHALVQLATTINVFKECHDINKYKHKLAYACNKRHPYFAVSHKEEMQQFRYKYGVRLVIGCDIMVK